MKKKYGRLKQIAKTTRCKGESNCPTLHGIARTGQWFIQGYLTEGIMSPKAGMLEVRIDDSLFFEIRKREFSGSEAASSVIPNEEFFFGEDGWVHVRGIEVEKEKESFCPEGERLVEVSLGLLQKMQQVPAGELSLQEPTQ